MITLGIDCGTTGALAVLDDAGAYVAVHDLPITVHGKLKWVDALGLAKILELYPGARVYIEHIHGTPKMGVKTCGSMGLTLGSLLSAVQRARMPLELVLPQAWKQPLGLIRPGATDKAKKSAGLDKARLLFPTAPLARAKDHNRAEALLIAWHGYSMAGARQGAARARKPLLEAPAQAQGTLL